MENNKTLIASLDKNKDYQLKISFTKTYISNIITLKPQ